MENCLTIVIPVFNREKIAGPTLESVYRQTARPISLILVDNNSTDGTLAMLKAWAEAHRTDDFSIEVLSESTPGAAAARNTGLKHVNTPWVLFFDSDDIMLPGHIARAVEGIKKHPDADILGWDVCYLNNGKRKTHIFCDHDCMWNSIFRGSFATLRWCARTDLVRRAGGWDAEVRLWDDMELSARMLALNPKVYKLEGKPTAEIFTRTDSISANAGGSYLDRMEAPLQRIRPYLGKAAVWADYFRVINLGDTARDSSDKDLRRRCDTIAAHTAAIATRAIDRFMLRFIYRFRRYGCRGHNYFLPIFIKKLGNDSGLNVK